jgi:hypothetical protein
MLKGFNSKLEILTKFIKYSSSCICGKLEYMEEHQKFDFWNF